MILIVCIDDNKGMMFNHPPPESGQSAAPAYPGYGGKWKTVDE